MNKTQITKKIYLLVAILLLLTSCSTNSLREGSSSTVGMDSMLGVNSVSPEKASMDYNYEKSAVIQSSALENKQNVKDQKIIKTGSVSMDTLHFDKTILDINKYIESIGGYIEQSSIDNSNYRFTQHNKYEIDKLMRIATLTYKIPEDKFKNAINNIKQYGTVISENTNSVDISDQYYDTDARLKSLKVQEERMLDILKKAVELKDVLELEKALNDTRYQIESITGTLNQWDKQITYSTLTIYLNEKDDTTMITPGKTDGMWNRIVFNFNSSIKSLINLTEELILIITSLIPLAIVIIVIYFISKPIAKKLINNKRKYKDNIKIEEIRNEKNNEK
ncbi:MAG: hypothetical protein K0R54_515 [Clostridiaceae bacterium]|nr:hypothetical protein [Clostridiaceae bacterium]